MGHQRLQSSSPALWTLAERQHGAVTRAQLLDLGYSPQAIKHRVVKGAPASRSPGRLRNRAAATDPPRPVDGCRPELRPPGSAEPPQRGKHLGDQLGNASRGRRFCAGRCGASATGSRVHRRAKLCGEDITHRFGIPVTTPILTLVDLAAVLRRDHLEAAINEADKRSLALRSALDELPGLPGLAALRDTLDRRTFTLTDSELERRFLQPTTGRAGPLVWLKPWVGHGLPNPSADVPAGPPRRNQAPRPGPTSPALTTRAARA